MESLPPGGGAARRRSSGGNSVINISARVDYGVRVLCTLAASDAPMTSEQLAASQQLPHKFLESILTDLRRGGVLVSKRGADGGYRLARPADSITLGDVVGPLVGTIAEVRGERPERTAYAGPAEHLRSVWFVMRDHLEAVLEQITIACIVSGDLPDAVGPVPPVPAASMHAPLGVETAPAG
jgi:Rrf2 family protein